MGIFETEFPAPRREGNIWDNHCLFENIEGEKIIIKISFLQMPSKRG